MLFRDARSEQVSSNHPQQPENMGPRWKRPGTVAVDRADRGSGVVDKGAVASMQSISYQPKTDARPPEDKILFHSRGNPCVCSWLTLCLWLVYVLRSLHALATNAHAPSGPMT
jgi:hypothetical protein